MAASTTNLILMSSSAAPLRTMKMQKRCRLKSYSYVSSPPAGVLCSSPAAKVVTVEPPADRKVIVRRSGNYEPSIWNFDNIQSLHNGYSEEKYVRRARELKEQVKAMLLVDSDKQPQPLDLYWLELVDNLERLGLAYHFEPQIHSILTTLYMNPAKAAGLRTN